MRAEVTPYFENTRQYALYDNSNILKAYYIEPVEGYVLHDNAYDTPVFDESTMSETGEIILGYTSSPISVWENYNFETNPREIYVITKEEYEKTMAAEESGVSP